MAVSEAKLGPLLRKASREGWRDQIRNTNDERAVRDGCRFDAAAAAEVSEFFRRFLTHSKGRWAGRPFELLEWQYADVVAPLFGWMRKDGKRRFRTAYVEIPKKNGKSTLCSGIALYLLVGDGESGAEIYSGAVDRDQASIVFNEASNMVLASPSLSTHLEVVPSRKRITFAEARSFYGVLSADAGKWEGLNIHGLIFDELHAQPNRRLWDTLKYGGASREQPLKIAITTAGWDRLSICYEQHEYALDVCAGRAVDTQYFGYIRAADERDDWTKVRTWRKANPSLGETITVDSFRADCREARNKLTEQASFKRYRLNIWTQHSDPGIDIDAWNASDPVADPLAWRDEMLERLLGEQCVAGLDVASRRDLTALVLLFGNADDGYTVLPWFWMPTDGLGMKEASYAERYRAWIRDGYIIATEGNETHYGAVREKINELRSDYGVIEVAIDALFQGAALGQDLQEDGLEVIAFRQGLRDMTAPVTELLDLVAKSRLKHGSNPVLTWMAANCRRQSSRDGKMFRFIKPSVNSPLKIDGIVALAMALGRAAMNTEALAGNEDDFSEVFLTL